MGHSVTPRGENLVIFKFLFYFIFFPRIKVINADDHIGKHNTKMW